MIVSFEQPQMVRLYQEELSPANSPLPWRFIADPDRKLYQQFQMQTGRWSQILGWTAMKTYLYLVFGKRRKVVRPSSRDFQQLGGDVLVDPKSIVRLHFISKNPADRPSIEDLKKKMVE